jgi:Rrf2 family protein
MLTQRSKYALRAMTMLAASKPGELVLIAEIAKQRKVPRKFLELILLDLKKHGLLHAKRGKNGGYCLARSPNQISFGEIVRITDGPLAPLACASLTAYRKCDDCEDEKSCSIRRVMRSVRDASANILDKQTLEGALKK